MLSHVCKDWRRQISAVVNQKNVIEHFTPPPPPPVEVNVL